MIVQANLSDLFSNNTVYQTTKPTKDIIYYFFVIIIITCLSIKSILFQAIALFVSCFLFFPQSGLLFATILFFIKHFQRFVKVSKNMKYGVIAVISISIIFLILGLCFEADNKYFLFPMLVIRISLVLSNAYLIFLMLQYEKDENLSQETRKADINSTGDTNNNTSSINTIAGSLDTLNFNYQE